MSNNSNSSSSDTGTPVGTGGTPLTPGAGSGGSGGSSTPPAGIDIAIADVNSAYDAVKAALGEPKTPNSRKRQFKARRKAQSNVPTVFDLTVAHPELLPMGTNSQELFEKLALLGKLQSVLTVSSKLHTSLKDAVTGLEGDLFKIALNICTIAERASVVDQGVVAVVKQMRASLALGPKQKHKLVKVPVKTVTIPVDASAPKPGTGTTGSAPEPVASNAGSSTPAAPAPGAAPTGK